jgi:hypothetical protein
MSDIASILRQSKMGLSILGVAAVLGFSANWTLNIYAQKNSVELTTVESEKSTLEAELTGKMSELKLYQSDFSFFETLRQQGLVGLADRQNWIEKLETVHQREKLPDTLGYSLLSPKAITAAENTEAAVAVPAEMHELELTLDGIHEAELIKFLGNYRNQVKGRYRLQSCVLSSPQNTGVSVNCRLFFFVQPMAPSTGARVP